MHSGKAAGPSLQGPGATEQGMCGAEVAGKPAVPPWGPPKEGTGLLSEETLGSAVKSPQEADCGENRTRAQCAGRSPSASLSRGGAMALQKGLPPSATSRLPAH